MSIFHLPGIAKYDDGICKHGPQSYRHGLPRHRFHQEVGVHGVDQRVKQSARHQVKLIPGRYGQSPMQLYSTLPQMTMCWRFLSDCVSNIQIASNVHVPKIFVKRFFTVPWESFPFPLLFSSFGKLSVLVPFPVLYFPKRSKIILFSSKKSTF